MCCKHYRNKFLYCLRCKLQLSLIIWNVSPHKLCQSTVCLFFRSTASNISSYAKRNNASTTSGALVQVFKPCTNMHKCCIITKEGRKTKNEKKKLTKRVQRCDTHIVTTAHSSTASKVSWPTALWHLDCLSSWGRVKHRPWVIVHTSHIHIHTLGQAGLGGANQIWCIHGQRFQCTLVSATRTCRHLRR